MDNYTTQSLYEGAYLMAQGFELAGKESLGRKVTLLFKGNSKINDVAVKFYNGGKVDAKKFADSYRTLKDYIFTR